MDARLAPLYEVFKLNSRLFLNCLEDLDDDRASWQPNAGVNSAAFIALHLVDTRYYIAGLLGLTLVNPFAALTDGKRGIADMDRMPPLSELRDAWRAVTGELRARLGTLDAAALDRDTGIRMPVDDKSLLGVLAFLMQHDSYHLGQLALLRKQVGLPAMTYK